ncbi:hypothetical protein FRC12_015378 [Ceratobasidium sp. 428]|nr:hypothetical protein FRC12_015378 [Ceratobasidium sp. 428]
MQRRGTRQIQAVRNSDGTARAMPTRNQAYVSDSETDSTDVDSIGSPRPNTAAIFATDSQLELLALSDDAVERYNESSQDNLASLANHPVFHDMGDYLKDFRYEPVAVTSGQGPAPTTGISPPLQLSTELEVTEQSNNTSLANGRPRAETQIQTTQDILDRDFGSEWDLYNTLNGAGEKAIIGTRLYRQTRDRYGLQRQEPIMVEGVEMSLLDVATWMHNSQGTIENWGKLEKKFTFIQMQLNQIENPLPKHDLMLKMLGMVEAGNAGAQLATLDGLKTYLARCEALI